MLRSVFYINFPIFSIIPDNQKNYFDCLIACKLMYDIYKENRKKHGMAFSPHHFHLLLHRLLFSLLISLSNVAQAHIDPKNCFLFPPFASF